MEYKKKHLLIVEDEEGIRSALNIVLEDAGYLVTTVDNGKDAVTIINKQAINLIITDILMPDGDGLELVNYLRKKQPDIKTIVISGGDPQFLTISKCLGADRILTKPFGTDDIKSMVAELMSI